MTIALAEILGISQAWLLLGMLVFLRVGTAFLVLPAIAEQFIPLRVRLGAALAMTALLTPALTSEFPIGTTPDLAARHFATEPVAGLVLGLGVRFVAMALQMAGTMAAQATSLSQLGGGVTPEPQPAISGLLFMAGLTLAMMTGLHVHLARMFLASYAVLPVGEFPPANELAEWAVHRVGSVFSLAFSLAAPFVISSLLYNLALGVINKAMPQLMVALVGAPAISLASLVLLLISLPFLLPIWFSAFETAVSNPMAPLP